MGNHCTIMFYHIIIRLILNLRLICPEGHVLSLKKSNPIHIELIFENITSITKNTPNLVAKILATKFGFVPDCSKKILVPENMVFVLKQVPSDYNGLPPWQDGMGLKHVMTAWS